MWVVGGFFSHAADTIRPYQLRLVIFLWFRLYLCGILSLYFQQSNNDIPQPSKGKPQTNNGIPQPSNCIPPPSNSKTTA